MPIKKKRKKQTKKRRVIKMSAVAEKTIDKEREERLALARVISAEITAKTITAGVTLKELETETYKVFLDVKKDRRSRRS